MKRVGDDPTLASKKTKTQLGEDIGGEIVPEPTKTANDTELPCFLITRLPPRLLGEVLRLLDAEALGEFAQTCWMLRSVIDVVLRAFVDFRQTRVPCLDAWKATATAVARGVKPSPSSSPALAKDSLAGQERTFRAATTRPITRARLESSLETITMILNHHQCSELMELSVFVGKLRLTTPESPFAVRLNLCGSIALDPAALALVPLSVLEAVTRRIWYAALSWNDAHPDDRLHLSERQVRVGGSDKAPDGDGEGDGDASRGDEGGDYEPPTSLARQYHVARQNLLNMLVDCFLDQFRICS
jgi:hypothetical protein